MECYDAIIRAIDGTAEYHIPIFGRPGYSTLAIYARPEDVLPDMWTGKGMKLDNLKGILSGVADQMTGYLEQFKYRTENGINKLDKADPKLDYEILIREAGCPKKKREGGKNNR